MDKPRRIVGAMPESAGHAVVIGFGVPGRAFVDWAGRHGLSHTIIESNETIVDRCSATGVHIIAGDARDPTVLRAAGADRATIILVTVPNETSVLELVAAVRRVNGKARLIARCAYVSTGLEAVKRGADDTVVAEEMAAREFVRLAEGARSSIRSPGGSNPAAVRA